METIQLNLEDSIFIMERAKSLLMITKEFLGELPLKNDKEEFYKLVLFNNRSNMLWALVDSIDDNIRQAHEIVKREVYKK